MKNLKKCLSLLLVLAMLVGFAPMYFATPAAAAENKTLYDVRIVSFIRGEVADLRCSELLEARIYKSTDGGATWEVATDVEGTPVSKLSYTCNYNIHNYLPLTTSLQRLHKLPSKMSSLEILFQHLSQITPSFNETDKLATP